MESGEPDTEHWAAALRSENLRKMESAGLVVRTDLSGSVRHVQYDLAEATMHQTHWLLDQLAEWAAKFGAENRITVLQANGSERR
jgi:DNA-binding HxlR family transcriptional regulator